MTRPLIGSCWQEYVAVTDVQVETVEGVIAAAVDPHGCFQVDDVAAGRMRLRVAADGAVYVTSWVTV